jgi:hypothetical protein
MYLDQGEIEKIIEEVQTQERGFLNRMVSGLFGSGGK